MTPSPFRTIWFRPRATVRGLILQNRTLHVYPLAMLWGIREVLDRACTRNVGDECSLGTILLVSLVLGSVGGLLSLWISAWLLGWTGKWLQGKAEAQHLRTACAWASVPVVFALGLWVIQLLVIGPEMFKSEMPQLQASAMRDGILVITAALEIVLSLWSLVLLCQTVAEAQGFASSWRGLLNVVLAAAVIVVPVALIAMGVVLLG